MSIPLISSTTKKKAVIGIDFGTSGSGFGYKLMNSTISDINVELHWPNIPTPYAKTLSSILYKAKNPVLIGWDALSRYKNLSETELKEYSYFEYMKNLMKTGSPKKVTHHITGVEFDVETLVVDYLKLLKVEIEKVINKVGTFKPDEIRWVYGVPSAWNDTEIQEVKKILVKAGIIASITASEDDLMIVTEPEAAGMMSFTNSSIPMNEGTTYMIIDAGGGTVDLTCHKVVKGHLREISITDGSHHCGSTALDKRFTDWLMSIANPAELKDYQTNCPTDFLDFMSEWYKKKVTIKGYDKPVYVSISDSTLKALFPKEHLDSRRGLILGTSTLEKIFQPVLDEIVTLVDKMLVSIKDASEKLDHVFLVGGFGQNEILRDLVKSKVPSGTNVFIYSFSGQAVIQGTVLLGLNPSAIRSRRSKYTYGIETRAEWDPERHFDRDHYIKGVPDQGVPALCKDLFTKYVTYNEDVDNDHIVHQRYNISNDTKQTCIRLFKTFQKDPVYVTEDVVEKCCEFLIDTDCSIMGSELNIALKFGKSFIDFIATDGKGKVIPHTGTFLFESKSIQKL